MSEWLQRFALASLFSTVVWASGATLGKAVRKRARLVRLLHRRAHPTQ